MAPFFLRVRNSKKVLFQRILFSIYELLQNRGKRKNKGKNEKKTQEKTEKKLKKIPESSKNQEEIRENKRNYNEKEE